MAKNIEDTLKNILDNHEQMAAEIKNQQLAQKDLETQFGQLVKAQTQDHKEVYLVVQKIKNKWWKLTWGVGETWLIVLQKKNHGHNHS